MFHAVGTVMEIFKTSAGSWIYPEANLLRIGGVPLFTGFMYAAVGSYLARVWRLFDFRFRAHPPLAATLALSALIYANFFAHHFIADFRLLLFALTAPCSAAPGSISASGASTAACRCCWASCWWPCSSGSPRTSAPSPTPGAIPTSPAAGKWCPSPLGSWFLLMIISYVMVSVVNRPEDISAAPVAEMPREGGESGGSGASLIS